MDKNHALEIVDCPSNSLGLKCKWVFNCDGRVRYRARLVSKGYSQIHAVDCEETFAPVVRHSILNLLIARSIK